MIKKLGFVFMAVAILFSAAPAAAQTGTPSSKLTWDQTAPDLATANSYIYKYYADGAITASPLTGVTCVTGAQAGVFTCSTSFPAFTPGSHSITLTASNVAGESVKSSPLAFTFVVVPGAPTNLRIQ
jgi:hypothetical protein